VQPPFFSAFGRAKPIPHLLCSPSILPHFTDGSVTRRIFWMLTPKLPLPSPDDASRYRGPLPAGFSKSFIEGHLYFRAPFFVCSNYFFFGVFFFQRLLLFVPRRVFEAECSCCSWPHWRRWELLWQLNRTSPPPRTLSAPDGLFFFHRKSLKESGPANWFLHPF